MLFRSKAIINRDFMITREHGQWIQRGSYKMMATFHPSALLRDPSRRAEAYQDFLKIAEALGV